MKEIFVTRSSMPSFEEYAEAIRPIFESRHLTNMGPVHQQFELGLKQYLGVDSLSLFVNGHMALETALQAMELEGEVITTPYTFASTAHAIARCGLTPVFCDVKPDDFTLDPDKIEALITDRTCAILPVHVYGNVCDVDAIEAIARRHSLKVIYDAAHTFGVTYRGRAAADYGDMAMLSFHATKVFHSIEGGAVVFHDPQYADSLQSLKNFGIDGPDSISRIGANAKMDEFRAAMGVCNLRHIDENIARREAVYTRYCERLGSVAGIRIPRYPALLKPNYSYYPVYFDEKRFGHGRDEVFEALREKSVFARKYFYPALNDCECYADLAARSATPVAHDASLHVLTLPIYADLALEDVDRICTVILSM